MDGNWDSSISSQTGNGKASNPQYQRQHSQMSGSEDEEDSEESESSALNNFRKEWEAELKHISAGNKNNTPIQVSSLSSVPSSNTPTQFSAVSPATFSPRRQSMSHSPVPVGINTTPTSADKIEEEAKRFFLMGVSFERRGDLYDAVRFYRRAMQLIPDIEHRLTLQSEHQENESGNDSETDMDDDQDENPHDQDTDDECDEDGRTLYSKFMLRIEGNGWRFLEPLKVDSKTHISEVPVEILMYMLRWVVSSELDVRSLDILATVSRGFYCLSRDEKLWKMACDRVWSSCEILGSQFSSYREMFLNRPRVRFDGCYISRITYVRPGEHSFQDVSYRPWHMVEYFRYLRFFPDGKMYFLTTADKPGVTVASLADRCTRNVSILKGTYRLFGTNILSASVKKTSAAPINSFSSRPGKQVKQIQETTEFHMDFEIEELRGRNNWLLRWTYYAVYINNASMRNNNRNNNGEENNGGITTTFELSPSKYPPLLFSRVKSYTLSSEKILE